MNKKQILKFLPNLLILIGIGFWLKILCFSPITNHYEANLKNYFQDNFERSSILIDSMNVDRQRYVILAVSRRTDDEPILITGNKIGKLQQIAIEALNKKLEQSDTSIHQIITDFDTNTSKLLWEISSKNLLITDKEIESLLGEIGFTNLKPFNDVDYIVAFQKNQIIQNTAKYLNFLGTKAGGGCYMCFEYVEPRIKFNETLKVNQTSTGKLYSAYHDCDSPDKMPDKKWLINDKSLSTHYSLAKLKESFTNGLPKTFNIECEYYKQRFDKYEIVIDTFTLQDQFIVHPIKK